MTDETGAEVTEEAGTEVTEATGTEVTEATGTAVTEETDFTGATEERRTLARGRPAKRASL